MASAGIPVTRLMLRSLRTADVSLPALVDPLRLGASFPQAMTLVGGLRPAAIFTTGGALALPVVAAAAALRVPVLLWEGNVIPGRSVRAIARLARVLAVSFPETCRHLAALPRHGNTDPRPLVGGSAGRATTFRSRRMPARC